MREGKKNRGKINEGGVKEVFLTCWKGIPHWFRRGGKKKGSE